RRREKEDLRLRGQTGLPRIACRRSLVLVRGDANLQKTSMVSGFSRDRVERLGEVYAECPAPQDGVSSRPRGTARGDSPVKPEVCDLSALAPYRPVQTAGRFSRKAATPSFLSSVE